jgi:hypothetical protein
VTQSPSPNPCTRYRGYRRYEHDAEVVYGDTDSVMVNFKTPDLSLAMKLGVEASELITKTFEKPINLCVPRPSESSTRNDGTAVMNGSALMRVS